MQKRVYVTKKKQCKNRINLLSEIKCTTSTKCVCVRVGFNTIVFGLGGVGHHRFKFKKSLKCGSRGYISFLNL